MPLDELHGVCEKEFGDEAKTGNKWRCRTMLGTKINNKLNRMCCNTASDLFRQPR